MRLALLEGLQCTGEEIEIGVSGLLFDLILAGAGLAEDATEGEGTVLFVVIAGIELGAGVLPTEDDLVFAAHQVDVVGDSEGIDVEVRGSAGAAVEAEF